MIHDTLVSDVENARGLRTLQTIHVHYPTLSFSTSIPVYTDLLSPVPYMGTLFSWEVTGNLYIPSSGPDSFPRFRSHSRGVRWGFALYR